MHPIDVIRYYHDREIANREQITIPPVFSKYSNSNANTYHIATDITCSVEQQQDEMKVRNYTKRNTIFYAIPKFKESDIIVRENTKTYFCPVQNCTYHQDSINAVKMHMSKNHLSREEKEQFRNRERRKRGHPYPAQKFSDKYRLV